MEQNVLEIRDLSVSFFTQKGELKAVNGVSLEVPEGRICGIVGESGCGKSMTARAVLGLVKKPGRITGGEIRLSGRDITRLKARELSRLRGAECSMVFQDPMTSLNPVVKVGKQVAEAIRLHEQVSKEAAEARVVEIFEAVGIADAKRRALLYPHQLSGGLRQRVMIAMAMVLRPRLLICDEPTTALDVTVEAQILRLMKQLSRDGTSILIISHNLGVIAQLCDRVYVMYAGRVVERADAFELFDHPSHPYTRGLLGAVQALRRGDGALETIPGVVPNLLHLPKGCSFSLRCGECMDMCADVPPDMVEIAPGHGVRCHLAKGEGIA